MLEEGQIAHDYMSCELDLKSLSIKWNVDAIQVWHILPKNDLTNDLTKLG